ncbi:PD-(D/E)XK nuclease family protein [Companilactobacillus nantensis]|uniref:ATP-dependent helicase deoxyribonuclease subunit B n=1 Tax=Companilactobacillus nantensis DSM 16982 TaxID=1423774 RepID=A0A0R1WLK7_9LACO|nr:PD-(D/E)XK nuclease family protein [Companilactobacillus nantensis]KRM18561.1 ATP-dependent helicase deoxyribonuclease subunit B [Companilactobacillus nantensis DSM 16982]GEO63253.1 ATP-dependent helicase/deoxyribonuclease subunit B [Companilactobacillus nantensis]
MTLNFVLGKNQYDHHQKMMELFQNDFQKDPDGQFFFLVPNHIKFESEINILKSFDQGDGKIVATNNVQTFSFSRLAWYFLRDSSDYNLETLTQTKSAMLLKEIVQSHQKDLKIFKHMIDKPGFIDQMISQFNEFLNGQVQPEDIGDVLAQNKTDVFADKIAELNLIYSDYLQKIQGYQTNDFQLNALADFLNQRLNTSHYHFYIEGFSTFTAAELNLVKTMIINSHDLNLSLVLIDPDNQVTDDADFFYRPRHTYRQLTEFAKMQQIQTKNILANKKRINDDLGKLEDYWIQSSGTKPIKASTLDNKNTVQIWKATDKQTEVSAISSYIRRLVARQDYRYKDFLIVARNLSEYGSFIESFMENNEVPYFIDLQKKMANHPFKRLLDLLFAIHDRGMQEDDVISLLRTELLIPEEFNNDINSFRQAVDLTENYALTNGITKRGWLGDNFKPTVKLDVKTDAIRLNEFQQINVIKTFIKMIYQQLSRFLDDPKDSTSCATSLYSFLTKNGVFEELLKWQQQATEQKNLALANQPEQIVNLFNQILDEYVTVFGDKTFDSKDFISILDAAFESATYSQIPSTLDAVSISEIGMIQPNNRQVTFILGSTTGNMPGATVSNNLVTDDERGFLNESLTDGKFLKDSDEVVNNAEPFLHDITFTTSSTRLIFTYPNLSEDSKKQELSSYVKRIQQHFDLTIEDKLANPEITEADYNHVLEYVGSKASTLNYLIRVSRAALDKRLDIPKAWTYVKNQLLNREPTDAKFALSSLEYQNKPVALNSETVNALYGDKIQVSISQLETFYMNEYEYFLKYGLRLYPRQLFEITPAQTGSIFHAVLDGLVKYLTKTGKNLVDFDDSEISALVGDLFKEQAELPENKIFRASDRMLYISDKLQSTLVQLVKNMKLQYQRNKFVPKRSEVTFGRLNNEEDLPYMIYRLPDGHEVYVRGKIDRIDEMNLDDKSFLTIIDYKSSDRKFDYAQFLDGLTMQMPTYIQSVSENLDRFQTGNKDIKIGGALYEHIVNPFIQLSKSGTPLQQQILNKFKLQGILLNDEDLLDNFDLEARTTKDKRSSKSPVVSFGKKDVITDDDLFKILNYNRHLIKNAGEKIYSGKLNLNPYRYGKKTALQYSDYRPIFEFDAMLPENEYHDIINYNKEDVLDKIGEILEVEDDA